MAKNWTNKAIAAGLAAFVGSAAEAREYAPLISRRGSHFDANRPDGPDRRRDHSRRQQLIQFEFQLLQQFEFQLFVQQFLEFEL
ncbi:hypothetical protein Q1M64_07255 (plasmid) [Sinorhizobium meliloti]|nr:hypothetical protein Q1M63_08665 [Sinorhizobium meliloti]WKL39234.1 hypothetical protein Q1M64_07255 [Sinorhizobium meliloti]